MAQTRQKGGTSIAVVAEWRHKHCRGCRMEAQWSPNGRQVIDAFCCKFSRQSGRCFCLPCRWSSYTETGFSGVRRPLSVLAIFWSFKGGTKVAILCKGGITANPRGFHLYFRNFRDKFLVGNVGDLSQHLTEMKFPIEIFTRIGRVGDC